MRFLRYIWITPIAGNRHGGWLKNGWRKMSIGYRNSIARLYFYITPVFILLDYFLGVNVRASALEGMPMYKNLYYGFCIFAVLLCLYFPGGRPWWRCLKVQLIFL